MITESIALIESKIIEVNQRIDDTVTNNTPQKPKKREVVQENPRMAEIQAKLAKLHRKIANKKLKIENARQKLSELEIRDGRDIV